MATAKKKQEQAEDQDDMMSDIDEDNSSDGGKIPDSVNSFLEQAGL